MEPRFHSGDLAIVRPAGQYKVGDIVAYHSSLLHLTVLHRIYAITDGRYTFKGDHNTFLDPVHPTRADLIGKLWIHVPGGGAPIGYLHTPFVAAVLAGGLGLLLLTGSAQRRGRRRRRQRKAPPPGPHGAPPVDAEHPAERHQINHRAWLAAAGAVAVVLLGVVVLAFANPVNRAATRAVNYTQKVSFGYRASAHPGPVYPSGIVTTGDPIFLALIHRLEVDVDYRLSSPEVPALHGTDRIFLKLTGPTGWSRTMAVTGTRRFTGDTVSARIALDLSQLQALLTQVARETGVAASGYTIAIIPTIHVRGTLGGHPLTTSYAPALSFQLEPLQLQPATTASASAGASATAGAGGPSASGSSAASGYRPSQTGSLATSGLTANTLGVAGLSLSIGTLRLLAPLGFLFALAATVLLAVLAARSPAFGESGRIRARYGHMIVPINAGVDLGWPAIDVSSIKALVRLAEASGQLILHNHDETADTYLVNDEGSVYRYQVQLPKIVWGEWSEPVTQLAA